MIPITHFSITRLRRSDFRIVEGTRIDRQRSVRPIVLRILSFASLDDGLAKMVVGEVDEELKGPLASEFFAHEQHRNRWRQDQQSGRGPLRLGRRQLMQPFAKRMVSDEVVMLDRIDQSTCIDSRLGS